MIIRESFSQTSIWSTSYKSVSIQSINLNSTDLIHRHQIEINIDEHNNRLKRFFFRLSRFVTDNFRHLSSNNKLNSIFSKIILREFQLSEFRQAYSQYVVEFNERHERAIQLIIDKNFKSTFLRSINQFKFTQNNSIDFLFYFVDWVIDKNRLKTILRQFDVVTVNYRTIFDTINLSINSVFIEDNSSETITSIKKQFVEFDVSRVFNKFRNVFNENSISSFDKSRTWVTIDISVEKIIYHRFIKFNLSDITTFTETNVQRICDRIVQNYVERYLSSFDSSDSSESIESANAIEETTNSFWRSKDFEYFDFKLSSFYDKSSIIRDDKDVYYRNVHLFVERILNFVVTKNDDLIRTNFNFNLRSYALEWYIEKLISLKRADFRSIKLKAEWIDNLKRRFKFNQVVVVNVLVDEHYIIVDVRNETKSINYVQKMINHAKNVMFHITYQQLCWVWRNFDSKLKRDIFTSTKNTTLIQFMQQIENKKKYNKKYIAVETINSVNEIVMIVIVSTIKLINTTLTHVKIMSTIEISQNFRNDNSKTKIIISIYILISYSAIRHTIQRCIEINYQILF